MVELTKKKERLNAMSRNKRRAMLGLPPALNP